MKVEEFYCDRCGGELNHRGVVNFSLRISGRRLGNAVDCSFRHPGETGIIDLCEDCHNMLQDEINKFFNIAKEEEGAEDE